MRALVPMVLLVSRSEAAQRLREHRAPAILLIVGWLLCLPGIAVSVVTRVENRGSYEQTAASVRQLLAPLRQADLTAVSPDLYFVGKPIDQRIVCVDYVSQATAANVDRARSWACGFACNAVPRAGEARVQPKYLAGGKPRERASALANSRKTSHALAMGLVVRCLRAQSRATQRALSGALIRGAAARDIRHRSIHRRTPSAGRSTSKWIALRQSIYTAAARANARRV